VLRHGRAQVRQALGKANQPVELRLLLLRPSFQAGGIAKDLIRSSFSSSTMRFPRAST